MPSKPRRFVPHGEMVETRPAGRYSRESACRRGYGRTWQKLRVMQLNTNPLCAHCLEYGRSTPGEEVDHILPLNDGGTNRMSNLQTLCKPCHSRKTAEDVQKRTPRQGG